MVCKLCDPLHLLPDNNGGILLTQVWKTRYFPLSGTKRLTWCWRRLTFRNFKKWEWAFFALNFLILINNSTFLASYFSGMNPTNCWWIAANYYLLLIITSCWNLSFCEADDFYKILIRWIIKKFIWLFGCLNAMIMVWWRENKGWSMMRFKKCGKISGYMGGELIF